MSGTSEVDGHTQTHTVTCNSSTSFPSFFLLLPLLHSSLAQSLLGPLSAARMMDSRLMSKENYSSPQPSHNSHFALQFEEYDLRQYKGKCWPPKIHEHEEVRRDTINILICSLKYECTCCRDGEMWGFIVKRLWQNQVLIQDFIIRIYYTVVHFQATCWLWLLRAKGLQWFFSQHNNTRQVMLQYFMLQHFEAIMIAAWVLCGL